MLLRPQVKQARRVDVEQVVGADREAEAVVEPVRLPAQLDVGVEARVQLVAVALVDAR